jgi:hypothetical protein
MVTTVEPEPKVPVSQFTEVTPVEFLRTRLPQSTEVTADESAKNLVVAETFPVQSVTTFRGVSVTPTVTVLAIKPKFTKALTTFVLDGWATGLVVKNPSPTVLAVSFVAPSELIILRAVIVLLKPVVELRKNVA